MAITKKLYNLKPGTVINRWSGSIVLKSAYDEFHGWYEAVELIVDDNGDGEEGTEIFYVTPSDLIGDEIG